MKNGRPKDARDRLTRKFLNALADDFEMHGVDTLARVREEHPDRYISAVAAVVPKEIEISRPLDGMSDDQLVAAIQALTEAMRAQVPPPTDDEPKPLVN